MTQRLKSLLNSDSELRPLLDKAQALSVLQRHFAGVVPPHFAQFSQVLSLQSGILGIAVANAAVAAKLRQLVPELIAGLQKGGCEVSGIRVKVQVSFSPSRPESSPRKLGKAARSALNGLSQTLGDSPLRLALKKLAETKE